MRLSHKLAALLGVIALTQMAAAGKMEPKVQPFGNHDDEDDKFGNEAAWYVDEQGGETSGTPTYWKEVVKPDLNADNGFQEQEVGSEGPNPFTLTIPRDCPEVAVWLKWGGGDDVKSFVIFTGLTGGETYEFHFSYEQEKKNQDPQVHYPGISGAWIYCPPSNEVPDGGATVALLGLGLIGLGLVQRRR